MSEPSKREEWPEYLGDVFFLLVYVVVTRALTVVAAVRFLFDCKQISSITVFVGSQTQAQT